MPTRRHTTVKPFEQGNAVKKFQVKKFSPPLQNFLAWFGTLQELVGIGHSLTHSLTHPLTHSLSHSLHHSLTHSLTHSPIPSGTTGNRRRDSFFKTIHSAIVLTPVILGYQRHAPRIQRKNKIDARASAEREIMNTGAPRGERGALMEARCWYKREHKLSRNQSDGADWTRPERGCQRHAQR